MSSLVGRQQLQQAWALSLEQPEWADLLRSELEFLGQDSLLSRLGQGSGEAWRQLARYLRSGRYSLEQARSQALVYLNPPSEFVEAWQRRQRYQFTPRPLKVDGWLYRLPQPRAESLEGMQRVVNLRQECERSKELCQELGLEYHWLPVPDMQTPRLDQVLTFLALFHQPRITLVHCYAGQGRTGLFVACYRIWRGLQVEQAITLTDREIGSRGMREHQRQWVREHADQLQPTP